MTTTFTQAQRQGQQPKSRGFSKKPYSGPRHIRQHANAVQRESSSSTTDQDGTRACLIETDEGSEGFTLTLGLVAPPSLIFFTICIG
ncbi:hypothetical protein V2G26_000496 [Clonostachys chloroleuca]